MLITYDLIYVIYLIQEWSLQPLPIYRKNNTAIASWNTRKQSPCA